MLNDKKTFAEISVALGKSKSTIAREVKNHKKSLKVGGLGIGYNNCKNQYNCQRKKVCGICKSPKKFKLCHRCSLCNSNCSDFEEKICARHLKPPYICNGCGKRPFCTLEKKVYISNQAQDAFCGPRRSLLRSENGRRAVAERSVCGVNGRLISGNDNHGKVLRCSL